MKRQSIAWAIVLSLVATLAATATPIATAAPAASPATVITQIDLNNPTAGINDPLATMPVLDRNCQPGQTDVNTATATELMSAFHIDADAAQRMIAGREWLKATDTISVPGVPRSSYQYIKANGCATPITLPPVPVNQCRSGSTALDLQVATPSQLMKIAGLSKTTALSLISARPLPDNLHQVAAPVVSGLSDSKITEILASGKFCITPAPFTFEGKAWRWVTPEHGGVVTATLDQRYALYVPPGAMEGSNWATVTPLPNEYGTVPTGDFHIYGSWIPEVAVSLPAMDGTTAATSYVYHEAADGPRLTSNSNLAAGPNNTVLAPMSSLSIVQTIPKPEMCTNPGKYYLEGEKLVYCDSHASPDPNDINNILQIRDTDAQKALAWKAFQQSRYGGISTQPCPPSNNQLVVSGGSLHSMSCPNAPVVEDLAKWTWINDSGDFFHFGNAYQAVTNNTAMVSVNRNYKGRFTTPMFDAISGDSNMVPPGDGLTVYAEQGQPAVEVRVSTQTGAPRALYWLAGNITMPLDAVADISESTVAAATSCVYKLLDDWTNFKAQFDCAVAAGSMGLDVSARRGNKTAAGMLKLLKWLGRGLAVGDYVGTIIQGNVEASWATASHQFLDPPPPPAGGGINPDGRYVTRVGREAYLVYPTNDSGGPEPGPIARHITSATDFNCYVTGYFVYDQRQQIPNNTGPGYRINSPGMPLIITDHDAEPCDTMTPSWTYSPDSSIVVDANQGQPVYGTGNVPPGIVVKMKDWLGTGSWYITPTGEIVSITSGRDYICLTNGLPVIYNFPFDATDGTPNIQTWRPVGYNKTVSCVNGTITLTQN